MESYVIVIGAARVDASGRSFSSPRDGEPNPGRIFRSLGGAGRNIALNLRLLDIPVKLVTVFGGDYWANRLRGEFAAAGVDVSLSLSLPGELTPVNISILDAEGMPRFAISDAELFSKLTTEYLESISHEINGAQAVVFDADIPEESIKKLAEMCKPPLIADPVSAIKAEKLREVLPQLFAVKPNIYEAETLTGICIESDYRLKKAAEALFDAGVENIYISLGKDGIFAKRGDFETLVPCVAERTKSSAGAGDAAVAAIVWAHLQGMDIRESAVASQAAADITLSSPEIVSPSLSPKALRNKM